MQKRAYFLLVIFLLTGVLYAAPIMEGSSIGRSGELVLLHTNDLHGALMASDAFFPFADCVEIAGQAGIKAIVQPGGSVRDDLSVDCCNKQQIAMVFTGIRHFKH